MSLSTQAADFIVMPLVTVGGALMVFMPVTMAWTRFAQWRRHHDRS